MLQPIPRRRGAMTLEIPPSNPSGSNNASPEVLCVANLQNAA
jgi:hypothetical protein